MTDKRKAANMLDVRWILAGLRCNGCSREPTREEVAEMMVVFGHKVSLADEGKLVWECAKCKESKP
jgi:hypothetical protein